MSLIEEWRPIPEHEGLYEASCRGRIRSLPRSHTARNRFGSMVRTLRGRTLSHGKDKDGYHNVRLCAGGVARTFRVSRLVLTAFVGPAPEGAEALHLDHDRDNNARTNLRWGTRLENEQQKDAAGRRVNATKLSAEDVQTARRMRAEGRTLKQIAAVVGTHYTNISLILRGVTWR